MTGDSECPEQELFRHVSRDDLSPQEVEALSRHLERCERCRCALDQLHATPFSDEVLRKAMPLPEDG